MLTKNLSLIDKLFLTVDEHLSKNVDQSSYLRDRKVSINKNNVY